MRKRYPHTFHTLLLVAFMGVVLGGTALWPPFAYVVGGAGVLWLIVVSVRRDREAKP